MESVTTKPCKTCGEIKPLSHFYKEPMLKDGYRKECKPCRLITQRAYYAAHFEEQREYNRQRKHNPEHRRKVALNSKRKVAKEPEKHKARQAVRVAIISGKLAKGRCEVCASADTHGHHDDYSKPLDVRWFCRRHHEELHGRIFYD